MGGDGGNPVDGMIGPSPPQADTVAALGALRWAELSVFALAGGWVPTTDEPEARVVLAGVSRHAARRAGVIGDRLPPEGALEASIVTVPASPVLADVVGEVAGLVDDAERLTVLGEVLLAGIADALDGLVATLSPVADATCLRVLPPLVADARNDATRLADCARRRGIAPSGVDVADVAGRIAAAGGWTPR